jgi:hypothetical protein
MRTKPLYTLPDRDRARWAETGVLRDVEEQFREAQKDHRDICLQRFVDGRAVVRGSGRERFRWLAARAAKATGCSHHKDPCECWIEILIQYLLEHDCDQEYIMIRPAASYVNSDKTCPPPSEILDGPWNLPGAIVGNHYTIRQLFMASADCCLWLLSRPTDPVASLVVTPDDLASSVSDKFSLAKLPELSAPEPRQAGSGTKRCAASIIHQSNGTEYHFTIEELAKSWALSQAKVRRMLRNEPGVLRFGLEKKGHRRAYVTLRIPASVAERVYRRCMCPGSKPDNKKGA